MENELLKGLYDCFYTPPELSGSGGQSGGVPQSIDKLILLREHKRELGVP